VSADHRHHRGGITVISAMATWMKQSVVTCNGGYRGYFMKGDAAWNCY